MSAVLLDTHAWLWWILGSDKLSAPAARAVAAAVAVDGIHLSAISAWEVAMLEKKGRLRLADSAASFVAGTAALPYVHFVDLDERVAVAAVEQAEPAHEDPADRFLAATARLLGLPLVTADARLRECRGFETIW